MVRGPVRARSLSFPLCSVLVRTGEFRSCAARTYKGVLLIVRGLVIIQLSYASQLFVASRSVLCIVAAALERWIKRARSDVTGVIWVERRFIVW